MANPVNHDFGVSLFPSGSQSAGTYYSAEGPPNTSGNLNNYSCRGLKVYINITAATGTLTVTIQGFDVASGLYYTILASTALASTGQTLLTVYPNATVTANVSINDVIPETFRISMAVAGGNITATVGACLIV